MILTGGSGWRLSTGPGNPSLTISRRQPLSPDPPDLVGEPSQPSRVAADALVGEVAPHHRGQVAVLLAERPVSVFPTPIAHCGNSPGETILGRDLPNHVLAVPRPSPHVGQAEEVEGGSIRCRMAGAPFVGGRKSTIGVLSGWSVSPNRARRLPSTARTRRASTMLSNAMSASSAYRTRVPSPLTWPHLILKPFVQHMMQEDVREAR